ncbi:dolichyl-P-Glc:Glc(2)Man(9)GlcNAc(2)-PP-dolichol alpha-1,2- glucosyltransferase [Aspergillus melleus]|uniref:dolichyl-P-Glc:Glc(2)Man(9)GlcNAc(2)-PP-dolichol alpha-1,2- glucosyltransferase n=1 Tax=Aspergillus melleus TaxID=138277 RepID=UPI001E8E3B3A|nr:glucosyltransferase [Aspergillus melleus]KAH8424597.1 glucosyltransferase [Aspergillus melleus]
MNSLKPDSGLARAARYAVPFVLLLIPIWMTKVNTVIPEPYLDEVFHVPQAQAYWHHKWTHWDPKITTPPGLYLWSYVICAGIRALRGTPTELDPEALRATNMAAGTVFLPLRLQTLLDTLRKQRNTRPAGAWLSHTVLNICLFPPIFFFSGLYYTDILSLLVVIEAYNWDLKRTSTITTVPYRHLVFIVFALLSLAFRQTNIFWVTLFLGGLQAVRTVKKYSNNTGPEAKNGLHDPLVSEAAIGDYFQTAFSLGIAVLRNLGRIIVAAIPYAIVLAAFGGFVVWNDGVALGHKEFHSVGVHLAQMLYIWPYIAFFSWPILVTPILNLLLPQSWLPKVLNYGFPEKQRKLPRFWTALVLIPAMLAVVHFNTIVHPFTLADNRHYMFYVFRVLLGSHPAARYAATVAYFLCGWAVISAFGFVIYPAPPQFIRVPASASPQSKKQGAKESGSKPRAERKQKPSKKTAAPAPARAPPISPEAYAQLQQHIIQRQRQENQGPRVSFVLVWLAATTVSLIVAPLVEPRYAIIPWVMWRLHLPPQPTPQAYRQQRPQNEKEALHKEIATNFPLFLETLWFLVINAVTGYVFLYKGFEWPQEPGNIQRFMW